LKPLKYILSSLTFIVILFEYIFFLISPVYFSCLSPTAPHKITAVSKTQHAASSSPKNNISLHARYAALIDADNNRLLYGKGADIKAPNASTTKIITLITALGICADDYIATTSAYAASMPDVQLNAINGEQFTIKDLYFSLMLRSHNDTAVIIAENAAYYYICNLSDKERNELIYDISFIPDYSNNSSFLKNISKEQSKVLVRIFTDLMNKKALEAGCTNTHFVTPNGLDASDENGIHQTTAYDLSVMMSYCIKNPDFIEITKSSSYSFSNLDGKRYSVTNANAFLSMYDNIISGKTGFTADAGYCYVCAYKDENKTFIVALLACGWPNNKSYKWTDSKVLLDYARNNFEKQALLDNIKTFNVKVTNGTSDDINVVIDKKYSAYVKSDDEVKIEYNIPDSIMAPVKKNDVIGTVTVFINNEAVKQYNIISDKDISKCKYARKVFRIIRHFLYFLCILIQF